MFQKGDVYSGKFCIECKTPTKEQKSMAIKKEWIDKLKEEAFAANKQYWALAYKYDGLGNSENFYIINQQLFNELLRILEEEELQ